MGGPSKYRWKRKHVPWWCFFPKSEADQVSILVHECIHNRSDKPYEDKRNPISFEDFNFSLNMSNDALEHFMYKEN